MSRENVEVVRRVLAAVASGDLEQVIAFADPEIVVDASRNVFNPRIYAGIDGLRQMLAAMNDAWEGMRIESPEFIDAGECVVVVGRLLGTGRVSGVEVTRPNGQIWTVRAGRVVRVEYGFTNRREALEAAGLSE